MSVRKLIVAAALLSAAATARAGLTEALPESATVTLLFIAFAVIAVVIRRPPAASPDA